MNPILRCAVTAFLCCIISPGSRAQSLSLQWAHAVTGTSGIAGHRLVIDGQKNVYVVGQFAGTIDFDPGSGTANLTALPVIGGNGFLAKYDAQGNYVFAQQLNAFIDAIALDNNGAIYVAGSFDSTVDFDPGTNTADLTSVGNEDFFVARYGPSGAYQSAFSMGNTGDNDDINAIATDAAGNLYITGSFVGAMDFDPGAGTTSLSASGQLDIFFAKYNSSSALVYAFRLSGSTSSSTDESSSILPLASGDVYLGGRFAGNIDLDPSSAVANFPNHNTGIDGFVAKYSATGNYISGVTYNGVVNELMADAAGNYYTMGTNPDSIDADPGPGKAMLYNTNPPSSNLFNVWLAKYDASGNYLHAKALHVFGLNAATSLAADQATLYVAGRFQDTIDLNPGGPSGQRISDGNFDCFLARYDAAGSLQLGTSFGSTAADNIEDITSDGQGGLWATGYFNGTVDFDPGPAATIRTETSSGNSMFFARYANVQAGISETRADLFPVKVFGADGAVIVDFTALSKVDARVTVLNMLGQTVAHATHSRKDMLRIALPTAASQIYVVQVTSSAQSLAKQVWVK